MSIDHMESRLNHIRYSLHQAYQNHRSAGYHGSFYNWLDDNETVDTEITEYRRLKRLTNEPA